MNLKVSGAEFHYDVAKSSGFQNISFSMEDGEVMSILGPNGCGKTTLLKCLNSLIKIGGGSITVDNRDIAGLPRAPRFLRASSAIFFDDLKSRVPAELVAQRIDGGQ